MNPDFLDSLKNSTIDPSILAQLEAQEAKLRENVAKSQQLPGTASATLDTPVVSVPAAAPIDYSNYTPRGTASGATPEVRAYADGPTGTSSAGVQVDLVEQAKPANQPTLQEVTTEHVTANRSLKDEIAELEASVGIATTATTGKGNNKFLDEYGDETWYVKNISNGVVVIADIEGSRVERGGVLNLLNTPNDVDRIRKSSQLREALMVPYKGKALLQRLTQEEYLAEMRKIAAQKAEVNRIKETFSPTVKNDHMIRPVVLASLEKYSLGQSLNPEIASKGWTHIEFINWAMTEDLSVAEIDHLLGFCTNADVRKSLYVKKASIQK